MCEFRCACNEIIIRMQIIILYNIINLFLQSRMMDPMCITELQDYQIWKHDTNNLGKLSKKYGISSFYLTKYVLFIIYDNSICCKNPVILMS